MSSAKRCDYVVHMSTRSPDRSSALMLKVNFFSFSCLLSPSPSHSDLQFINFIVFVSFYSRFNLPLFFFCTKLCKSQSRISFIFCRSSGTASFSIHSNSIGCFHYLFAATQKPFQSRTNSEIQYISNIATLWSLTQCAFLQCQSALLTMKQELASSKLQRSGCDFMHPCGPASAAKGGEFQRRAKSTGLFQLCSGSFFFLFF